MIINKKIIKHTLVQVYRHCKSITKQRKMYFKIDPQWQLLQDKLQKTNKIIDIGCGSKPHPRSWVGIDGYLKPTHRAFGGNKNIDSQLFSKKKIRFVLSFTDALPFHDKEFDFAYSHHVFEHVTDPIKTCREMIRIAKAGAVITPSPFTEIAFGREYHLWMVFARQNTLFFIKKISHENRPFGVHPIKNNNKWRAVSETNPFDILLNDGNWYHGKEKMNRLSLQLRRLWYSHSPVIETVFLWNDSFKCVVIEKDGTITQL